jgi:hypothetical protein
MVRVFDSLNTQPKDFGFGSGLRPQQDKDL